MNTRARFALILTLLLLAGLALVAVSGATSGDASPTQGGAPTVVAYQGEVRLDGAPYTGDAYVKFAVVNADGDTTYWSNDGTSANGGQPSAAVPLAVSHGLFSVLLGDTTLDGMTQPLTAGVFSEPDRTLRVWFSTSLGGPFSHLAPDTRIAAVPYALQAQQAANADTVDGLHAHELGIHYQNVVVVAKSGGDYASIQAAIDSITDATAGNAYLVWVAPGVYVEQVTMVPHVHLQGAGQEATVISSTATSGWPPTQATLVLTREASLRDLTVANDGAGLYNLALMATGDTTHTMVAGVTARAQGGGTNRYAICLSGSGARVTLQQVTALAEDGTYNAGLYNSGGAAATLHGGSFTGRGGSWARGIDNTGSSTTLEATAVTALAEDGSSTNYSLHNSAGAAATLHGGSFTARGGGQAIGISSYSNGTTLEAEGITALGEDGSTENYGLYNHLGAAATLRGGSFTAREGTYARGIQNQGSETMLETESVTALAENGTSNSRGLSNSDSATATLHGGSFAGRGGEYVSGIYNYSSGATLEAENVTALGENGTYNYGLFDSDGAAATLSGGSFTGRGGTGAFGIYNSAGGTTLEATGITALAENSSWSFGLQNSDGAAATLSGGSFTGRAQTSAHGILNQGSGATLEAESLTALGEGGALFNYGLENANGAAATLGSGSFTARGGTDARGIYNDGAATTLQATNVTALGQDGTTGGNYGLYNEGATATIDSSQFAGDSGNALYQDGGTVRLGVCKLDGGASRTGGTLTCFQVYAGNYAAYTCP
jgi:hypothetical protein